MSSSAWRTFALAFLLAVGCLTSSKAAEPVSISISVKGEVRTTVVGKTNLPAGMELMVTLKRSESAYQAQAKTVVSAGAFEAGPFTAGGLTLNPGTYSVQVTSTVPMLQPGGVQAVIGKSGENLIGPMTKESVLGGKVIDYRTTVQVGSGSSTPEQDAKDRKNAQEKDRQWMQGSCRSACMMEQTQATRSGRSFNVDQCYRRCSAPIR